MSNTQTVLVKSDDPAVFSAVSQALSEVEGFRVIFCEDDRSALRRLDEIDVDLVLCDLARNVSERDNALIRSRLSHASCARIIAFERDAMEEGIAMFERTASFMYLIKPLDPRQVRIVVKRTLEHAELARRHRILSRELNSMPQDRPIFHQEK